MERSSFLYISLIQITSHPLLLWKSIFIFFLLELHDFTLFKPKIFWGGTPVPISLHIYNIKTIMSYACLCREGIAVVQKDHAPTENKLVCT